VFLTGADPLAGAAGAGNGAPVAPPGVQQQQQQLQQAQHFPVMTAPQQDMLALAQHYERVYLDMLSRPPYNSDPALAQQVRYRITAICMVERILYQRYDMTW